jgi:hypothetical protein
MSQEMSVVMLTVKAAIPTRNLQPMCPKTKEHHHHHHHHQQQQQ